MLMNIFCISMWNSFLKSVRTFQLHSVHFSTHIPLLSIIIPTKQVWMTDMGYTCIFFFTGSTAPVGPAIFF
jgi:hypothetical protein